MNKEIRKKRLILVGRGGSGKDHLRKMLEEIGFKYCVSHTTRPPREGEVNGKDYWFINTTDILKTSDLFYESVYFNDWFYGTSLGEFESSNLFIMTPNGISKIKPSDRKESIIVYLNPDSEIIRKRMVERLDPKDSVDRRIGSDNFDFMHFKDYDLEINDPFFKVENILEKIKDYGLEINTLEI